MNNFSRVMNYIRTKISFALLKIVLISVTGVSGVRRKNNALTSISDIAFNLIPIE